MLAYAAAVILGACLLFLVQPLIAKIILPWFGGTSAVWSAALVFFQTCVLVGYAYAHWLTTHVRSRLQGVVHVALLAAGCALLPIVPSEAWRPTPGSDPTLRILLLLTAEVGLPAVLLSATSPLLQVWYMRRTGSEVPYRLFAWSNFGSMVALLSFPFLLEPLFGSRVLAIGWSVLFVAFALFCAYLAWLNRAVEPMATPTSARTDEPYRSAADSISMPTAGRRPTVEQMALWMLLAALASALLVTVSAHLSVNVAPIPLLWVMPLAIYLLTFMLCFGSSRLYHRTLFFPWLAAALGFMAYTYINQEANLHVQYTIPLFLVALFMCCMVCHGELMHRRPPARYLTTFYLLIALGGALGGMFVAIIAPNIFDTTFEMPLLLIYMAILGVVLQWRRRGSQRTLWLVRAVMLVGIAVLTVSLIVTELAARADNLLVRRNFYGVLRVRDALTGTELESRHLVHGTISHGSQYQSEARRFVAGSYFSATSGVGRALRALQEEGPVRYGVIGLGVGVLSSYARGGDYLRIYEINPEVLSVANEYFTFLSHARQLGADVDVLLGDARLTLASQEHQRFDLLAVDAFSSDAIPVHLLTREAIELYFKHLEQDGVLAVHISNRYLDLVPVCLRAAEYVSKSAAVLHDPSDGESNTSVWVLIASNGRLLHAAQFQGADIKPAYADADFVGWTDEYSSVWPVLKLQR